MFRRREGKNLFSFAENVGKTQHIRQISADTGGMLVKQTRTKRWNAGFAKQRKYLFGASNMMAHHINYHGMLGNVICLKCQNMFPDQKLKDIHICKG